jgi:hypothetical protein
VAESTWQRLALPILEAVATLERPESGASTDDLALATGLDHSVVAAETLILIDSGYLSGYDFSDPANIRVINVRLRERGKVETGQWPSDDPTELLFDRLDVLIESADEKEKPKLIAVRDSIFALGKSATTALITAWIKDVVLRNSG